MNVVGRVGSLISQGVYSVATPFHPFGGAVDIIVVQQQDGTFRSTPWYVRFGKFQGVLKGTEKIVRINVNGIEADFHMCLENSGEAYFVREDVSSEEIRAKEECVKCTDECATIEDETVFSGDGSRINCSQHVSSSTSRIDSMVSNSGTNELKNWNSSYVEHVSEPGKQQFFEFSKFQSKVGSSVELTEFRSNRCSSLDNMEHLMDSQDSDSEVVLFSVDGHVLTAPVLSSEDDTQNLQLYTPQFHLGPGEGDEFCEGSTSFDTREETWATHYISKLEESSNNEGKYTNCSVSVRQSLVYDEVDDDMQEIEGNVGHIVEIEACSSSMKLADSVSNMGGECTTSVVESDCAFDDQLCIPNKTSSPQGSCPKSIEAVGLYQNDGILDPTPEGSSPFHSELLSIKGLLTDTQTEEGCSLGAENTEKTGEFHHIADEFEITTQEGDVIDNDVPSPSRKSGIYVQTDIEGGAASSQRDANDVNVELDISICGGKLFDGMGLSEAAEAFDAHRVSEDEFKNSASSITRNENLVVRYKGNYLRWEKAAQIVLGLAAFGLETPVDSGDVIQVERNKTSEIKDDASEMPLQSSSRRWRLWRIPFRRVKTMENTNRNSSNEGPFVVSDSNLQTTPTETSTDASSPLKEFIKTNIPTTEQIASLNLKEGQNIITFSFSTRVLGMQEVDAHIYLWMWNAQIVISDVDGTITRSDVLGQFMPLVGRDWSQFGVTQLFSAIKENGYQLLFLSARAIVQAYLTRSFLLNLKQDGKALPNGPVVISPDGLFPSLYREVIRRAPHEFKIACLQDIKALFPVDYNPFYAGFGNRDTDELSYRKIGIPKGKIFIINPKGEVAINNRVDVKSYTSLHTLVNDMFPPASLVEQEDFNSWNFWKMPLSCVDVDM